MKKKMKKAYLVGAGPGDRNLLTVKAKSLIESADCIIYDRLVDEDIIGLAKESCELIYVGKENHNHTLKQDEINELIAQKTVEHEIVVRLKGGDPYVFGRGGEEALYLHAKGIEVEVVPGVTSAIAALTYAGIPITHRGVAGGFHVITGHSKEDILSKIRFELLVNDSETLCFLMSLSHIEDIADRLIEAGRKGCTPAAVISNGTLPTQKKVVGTLENIASLTRENAIKSPAIFVVGNAVELEQNLSFFERLPLFGKTFLVPYILSGNFSYKDGWITVKRNLLAEKLKELGAKVISLQTGIIEPVECELDFLQELNSNDYIVFTSKNAVYSFAWNLKRCGLDIRAIGSSKIAAVGRKTAEVLKEFALEADVVSEVGTADGLAKELQNVVSKDTKVVWFAADEVGGELENTLAASCKFARIVCYKNAEKSNSDINEMELNTNTLDGVIFTSASNVKRTYALESELMQVQAYSIGKSCSKCLDEFGSKGYKEALNPSYEDLIELLVSEMLWVK